MKVCLVERDGGISSVRNGGGGGKYLRDSASGDHCTDFTNFLKKHRLAASGIPCFERTADHKSSSLSKFVKNSTSNTANLRILEEESQASHSSLRADEIGAAIYKNKARKVDSSSTILESQDPLKSPTFLESTFDKSPNSNSNALFPSLRDTAEAVAWQSNSAPAESNQINGARKACNLESVVGGLGAKGVKKRGDKGVELANSSPPVPP